MGFKLTTSLKEHYQLIGAELLNYETSLASYAGANSSYAVFRQGVAVIPREVLESYLEDLLDLETREENLYIVRRFAHLRSWGIPALGLVLALCAGLQVASAGATLSYSFPLTVAMAIPFAVLFYLTPRVGTARRLALARVVSREVARRRGHEDDTTFTAILSDKMIELSSVISGAGKRRLQGAAQGIADPTGE